MNKIYRYSFLLLITLFFQKNIQAQDQPSMVTALNSYVHYTNESIHGMLIVHRLLENFNQEVNQYVNLQSNQLNFYANADLPKNVFVDPQQSFYKIAPFRWYEVVKKESTSLPTSAARKLNASADNLKTIMNQVNDVRFELEKFIKNNDLTKKGNQDVVFEKLKNCEKLYENFYRTKETLRKDLFDIYSSNIKRELTRTTVPIQTLLEFHRNFLNITKLLRYKTTDTSKNRVQKIRSTGMSVLSASENNPFFNRVKKAVEEIILKTEAFDAGKGFSKDYKLYGEHYFYHNVELAAAFNSYGMGFVKYANKYIKNVHPTGLLMMEEPHYYKVIFPEEAAEEKEETVIIKELPKEVNDREVIVRQQIITVDSLELDLNIYDHKEMDGDIISINFNGKWILEKHRLTKQWLPLKIKLNPVGENYLILHAENLGGTPPNTAAIRYLYKGKKRTVILNSNLNESEMIQLNYMK